MSTTYGGTNTYPALITLPSDGDTRDAASVNTGLEALADRTEYLRAQFPGLADSMFQIVPLNAPCVGLESAGWTSDGALGSHGWIQADTATAHRIGWTLPTPSAGKLYAVSVWFDGNGSGISHVGPGLPATLPIFYLYESDALTGTFAAIKTTTIAPANLAAYETRQRVDIIPASSPVVDGNATKSYVLIISGETGADARDGCLLIHGHARMTLEAP